MPIRRMSQVCQAIFQKSALVEEKMPRILRYTRRRVRIYWRAR